MESPCFDDQLSQNGLAPLCRERTTTLQLNLTRRCNLACVHCHVESSPRRHEAMGERVVRRILELISASPSLEALDLTGGAPEMHPSFRELVAGARARGLRVIDRCNLTILYEPGQEDTARFLADQGVEIVASLPCYTRENVERQRGRHVFDRSIEALRWLNRLGYAQSGSRLVLDLVYNPLGASLPPPQAELEARYREELTRLFGIRFNRLYTITNMPIRRFADWLRRRGEYESYGAELVRGFNRAAVPQLMCRSLISVGYEGQLYDCDFNQALGLGPPDGAKTIWDIERLDGLDGSRIATGSHCFGCTAGSGSSCRGALV
ncbi:MAG: arsenosugar biosynthesis radical SAM (seleno)protein ArsS [Myxococcota bacterium]